MYFITTFDSKDGDTRCVGYFKTFKQAENAVLNNTFDIWETCYDYAIIENIPEGLYQYDFHPTWYKFHKLTRKYRKCKQPSFIELTSIGYAIG